VILPNDLITCILEDEEELEYFKLSLLGQDTA